MRLAGRAQARGLALAALLLAGSPAGAQLSDPIGDFHLPEPDATGWAFYLDNDALALVNRDQQYTGGFALTLSGARAKRYWFSLDPILARLDRWSGFADNYRSGWRRQLHSVEFGLMAFTPADVLATEPIRDDHPYASLVFMANTQLSVMFEEEVSYQSTLTLGLLGTRLPQATQNLIHDLLDQDKPRGWRHQISEGGEPTAKYTLTRQQTHINRRGAGERGLEVKSTIGASVGYTNEFGGGVNLRWGALGSPWWSFNPHYAEYINLGTPVVSESWLARRREFYLWADVSLRYRLYNALLQGQFRDSEVTFDRNDLNPWIAQVGLGMTREFGSGLRLSFTLTYRSRELEAAAGLPPVWGGLILSRSF